MADEDWTQPFDGCEDCGRSVLPETDQHLRSAWCDSCEADFKRLWKAGRLRVETRAAVEVEDWRG